MKRGDVVIVPFPHQDKPGHKIRPALIVQSDGENQRLANTVLAMITGNLADSSAPTNVLVDPNAQSGTGSGLSGPSLIKCTNLATIRQHRILHLIGHLPTATMHSINLALKTSLELP